MTLINSCAQAVLKASEQTSNVVGTCQFCVRGWFNAPSAGDRDKDGDADAKDGWLAEPIKYRVVGDRNPPNGVPLYFEKNGGTGYGHRALSVPRGVRSTDMMNNRYSPGHTSTVTAPTKSEAIAIIEQQMGVSYVGWSKTIDSFLIPDFIKSPIKKITQGWRVRKARRLIKRSNKGKAGSVREQLLNRISDLLKRVPKL